MLIAKMRLRRWRGDDMTFKKELFDQLMVGFQTFGEYGIEFPEFLTEVKGYCFHVIPIVIYT